MNKLFENKGDFNKHIMQDYLQILLDSEIPISFYGEIFKVQEAKYLLKVITLSLLPPVLKRDTLSAPSFLDPSKQMP